MSKQSFNTRVKNAVVSYAKGSRKLVELFEEAASNFYPDRQVAEFSFFLNALKDFPVIQKAAVETTRTFGKFEIELKNGEVKIANKGKPSEKQLEIFKERIATYVAAKHNSLLAAHQNKLLEAFDLTKRMTGFENSATSLIVAALANDSNLSKPNLIEQLKAVLTAINGKDLTEKVNDKKAEIAAAKITIEDVAEAANTAAPAESETAA